MGAIARVGWTGPLASTASRVVCLENFKVTPGGSLVSMALRSISQTLCEATQLAHLMDWILQGEIVKSDSGKEDVAPIKSP